MIFKLKDETAAEKRKLLLFDRDESVRKTYQNEYKVQEGWRCRGAGCQPGQLTTPPVDNSGG